MMDLIKRAVSRIFLHTQFIRFIVSILILVLLQSAAILLIKNISNQYLLDKEIDRLAYQNIDETRRFMDTLLNDIHSLTIALANNKKLSETVQLKDIDAMSDRFEQIGNRLLEVYVSSYSIDSIYVYYKTIGMIQSPIIGVKTLDELENVDWLTAIQQNPIAKNWFISTPVNGAQPPIVSLIQPIPLLGNSVDGAIIVNLNSKMLFEVPLVQQDGEQVWIVSPDGNYGFETDTGNPIPTDRFQFVSEQLRKGKESFALTMDDSKYSFRQSISPISGWKYVYAVENSSVRVVKGPLDMMVAAVMILFTIGTALYMYWTGRNIYRSIMEKDLELSERIQKNYPFMKESFLYQVLNDKKLNKQQLVHQFRYFGMDISEEGLLVIVFRIDDFVNFSRKYSDFDQGLIIYFLDKTIEELASESFRAMTYNSNSRDVVVLCSPAGPLDQNEFRIKALALVDRINHYVEQNLSITTSVGIGDVGTDASQIYVSYRQALLALESRFVKGFRAVIPCWELPPQKPLHTKLFDIRKKAEQELLKAMKTKSEIKACSSLVELKNALEQPEGYSLGLIQHTFWELLLVIIHRSAELGARPEAVNITEMYDKIMEMETCDHIMAWFEETLQGISNSMAPMEENAKSADVVQQIVEYIDNNYDKEISLGGIADQLGLDPSYVSRLFKNESGVNFMEYLLSLRIKRAKELLITTKNTVADVGRSVGYENTHSFIRIFKKYEGVTPGQYKDAYHRKALDINELY